MKKQTLRGRHSDFTVGLFEVSLKLNNIPRKAKPCWGYYYLIRI